MSLQHICTDASERLRNAKMAVCKRAGGVADLHPMVDYKLCRDDKRRVRYLPPGDVASSFPEVWKQIIEDGVPEFVILLMEGYSSTAPASSYDGYGHYARDFKENPLSEVNENLIVVGVEIHAGRQHWIRIPYSYDDRGMPTYGEADAFTCTPDNLDHGVIPEMLADCVQEVASRKRRRKG